MTKVIINSDDFGLTKGINEGTIKAYQAGMLKSTTAMMNGNAVEEAFQLARENPGLGIGIHFVLTYGRPLSDNVPSLTDENGDFLKNGVLFTKKLNPKDVEKEYRLQLEKFMSFGSNPTHIDSHHHTHMHADVFPIAKQIAKELDIPVRRVSGLEVSDSVRKYDDSNDTDMPTTTSKMLNTFYGPGVSEETLLGIVEENEGVDSIEVMTHPAVIDDKLREISSYCDDRAKELSVLTNQELKAKIEGLGAEFIKFTDLKKM